MSRYAANTSVTADKSRDEIEATLMRYGADMFGYVRDGEKAAIQFRCHGRMVRFTVTMPDRHDPEFTETPTGRERKADAAFKEWQQACRQRWRALALVVKAKLEAVESGVAEFEEEFLPYTMLPDGRTVSEFMLPQIERAYELGEMPSMLALPAPREDS